MASSNKPHLDPFSRAALACFVLGVGLGLNALATSPQMPVVQPPTSAPPAMPLFAKVVTGLDDSYPSRAADEETIRERRERDAFD